MLRTSVHDLINIIDRRSVSCVDVHVHFTLITLIKGSVSSIDAHVSCDRFICLVY